MSQMLKNMYSFCQKTKHNSSKLTITRYNHSQSIEVTEHHCEHIEFETTPYQSLNMTENDGEKVLSFMIQDCVINFEEYSAKVFHSNQLYLAFDFEQ